MRSNWRWVRRGFALAALALSVAPATPAWSDRSPDEPHEWETHELQEAGRRVMEEPIPVGHLTDAIGVNTHLTYTDTSYRDFTVVRSDLQYLGVHLVRDSLTSEAVLPRFRALGDDGISFDVLVKQQAGGEPVAWQLAETKTLAPHVRSIEGPNEVNTWPVHQDGLTGFPAATAMQRRIYGSVHGEGRAGIRTGTPVLGYTLGGGSPHEFREIGDISGVVDAGNAHIYFNHGVPPYDTLVRQLNYQAQTTPHRPMVITETGYYTAPDATPRWGGVTAQVQAKYTLDLLLDACKLGVDQTYLYELMDEKPDPAGTDRESHFGLFNADGSPKPVATGMHNLFQLLQDGSGKGKDIDDSTLDYSLAGMPSSGNSLLMRKTDGSYWLALWNEPEIWDATTRQEISQPDIPVSLTLAVPARSIHVFDPMQGTKAIHVSSAVDHVDLQLPDHPLLVEIVPGKGA